MSTKLGIIAGKGTLPEEVARACEAAGRSYYILAIESETDPGLTVNRPHAWVRMAAVGKALKLLRAEGIREIVFAGGIERPSFTTLIPDMAGAKLMGRILSAHHGGGGDDALLGVLVKFMEDEGFTVTGAEQIAGNLLGAGGVLGKVQPTEADRRDIALGLEVAHALGKMDVGQAVVVQQGMVLGVEAIEGTDALIARCAVLKRPGGGGVLVKAKKPQQDSRVDLPSLGPITVEKAAAGGFAGIAFETGGTLLLQREEAVVLADRLGVFLYGA
ncbi:MAG: UDP-2,3-diacylglucosamine diphosphatase LpxI [Alphaproteobacteria bacterium]|nr:UDP-2,3-diacylglucosamine diphosphatase LpxI [Alphaproteobacteria bacterium]